MLADNPSKVGVSSVTISSDTTSKAHICMCWLVDVKMLLIANNKRVPHVVCACTYVFAFFVFQKKVIYEQ